MAKNNQIQLIINILITFESAGSFVEDDEGVVVVEDEGVVVEEEGVDVRADERNVRTEVTLEFAGADLALCLDPALWLTIAPILILPTSN